MFPIWVWLLVAMIIVIILYLLWKIVQVPSISVATDKSLYDRTETVQISGTLIDQNSDPMAGKTVSGAITPPVGDAYVLPDAITDANGDYSMTWEIPDDADGGTYTVLVACLGASGQTTFTQSKQEVVALACRVPSGV
jgi:uncharacterized protein YfaS (alpha-2-macroglobulin family)